MNTTTQTRTRADVEKLKADWMKDGCWDIEDTEGFEDFHEELLAFRHEFDRKSEEQSRQKLQKKREHQIQKIQQMGLTDLQAVAIELLEVSEALTSKINDLESQIEAVRSHTRSPKYIY